MSNIQIETSLLKSLMCNVFVGTGLVGLLGIVYIIGLYLQFFVPEGYEFLITLFVLIVFVGAFFDEIINVVIQKRKFYILDNNGITVGSKSLLLTTQETYPITQNSSIKIHFEKLGCFESIELYLFSEKILIEKSELSNQDYEGIKSTLLIKSGTDVSINTKSRRKDVIFLMFSIALTLLLYTAVYVMMKQG